MKSLFEHSIIPLGNIYGLPWQSSCTVPFSVFTVDWIILFYIDLAIVRVFVLCVSLQDSQLQVDQHNANLLWF